MLCTSAGFCMLKSNRTITANPWPTLTIYLYWTQNHFLIFLCTAPIEAFEAKGIQKGNQNTNNEQFNLNLKTAVFCNQQVRPSNNLTWGVWFLRDFQRPLCTGKYCNSMNFMIDLIWKPMLQKLLKMIDNTVYPASVSQPYDIKRDFKWSNIQGFNVK